MSQLLGVNKSGVATLLGVTTGTLQQRKNTDQAAVRLSEQLTDRAFQIARLMNDVIEYFGSRQSAIKWMNTPNIGLGDVTPLSLCTKITHMEMVRNTVNHLKYGITA